MQLMYDMLQSRYCMVSTSTCDKPLVDDLPYRRTNHTHLPLNRGGGGITILLFVFYLEKHNSNRVFSFGMDASYKMPQPFP